MFVFVYGVSGVLVVPCPPRPIGSPMLRAVIFALFLTSPALAQTEMQADAVTRSASARVRPGDRIVMHVLREPDLSDTLTVSERGEAAFPKLGIMQIAQLSILQLQDTLRQRYSAYLRNP